MTNACMLDLETYGTGPNAAIKSIGAIQFDPEEGRIHSDDAFHVHIDLVNSDRVWRGEIDPATVEWWLRQPAAAVAALLDAPSMNIIDAVTRFTDWVWARFGNGSAARSDTKAELWSNGPTFDEIILRSAYRRTGQVFPFHFRASRCMRTAMALGSLVTGCAVNVAQKGTQHDALADAVYQAERVCLMYKALRER